MKQKLKKIWSVVSTILVILIVLCSVFLMGSRIIGYRVFNILTGSMSPQYNDNVVNLRFLILREMRRFMFSETRVRTTGANRNNRMLYF